MHTPSIKGMKPAIYEFLKIVAARPKTTAKQFVPRIGIQQESVDHPCYSPPTALNSEISQKSVGEMQLIAPEA